MEHTAKNRERDASSEMASGRARKRRQGMDELVELIGRSSRHAPRRAFIRAKGGTSFSVPLGITLRGQEQREKLVQIIGREQAAKLIGRYGGTTLYIPTCRQAFVDTRDRDINLERDELARGRIWRPAPPRAAWPTWTLWLLRWAKAAPPRAGCPAPARRADILQPFLRPPFGHGASCGPLKVPRHTTGGLMGFFRLLLRPRWRLLFFGLIALALQAVLLLISPAQMPVVLYKLALVMLAAILGMFFDVAVFPFATPDSYLDGDWKRAPGAVRLRCADFAIAKGCLWPFLMACLRRAAVVAAFVVAVSVGL